MDLLLETPPSSQACHDGSVRPWGVKRLLRVLAQTQYVLMKRQAPHPGLPPPPASSCHPGRAPSHKSCAQGIQADFNSSSPRGLGRKIYHVHALSKRNNQNRAKGNRTIHCPAMDYPMPGMLSPPFPTSEQTKADWHQGAPEGREDSGVAHLPLPAQVGCTQLLAGNLQSARPSPLPRAPEGPKAGRSPVASEPRGPQAPTQPLGVAPAFYRPALEMHPGPDSPCTDLPTHHTVGALLHPAAVLVGPHRRRHHWENSWEGGPYMDMTRLGAFLVRGLEHSGDPHQSWLQA